MIAPSVAVDAYVVGSLAALALSVAGASCLVPAPGLACLLKSFEEIAVAEKPRDANRVAQWAVERRGLRAAWSKTLPTLCDGSYAVIPESC